jgi:uncharacterized membrane protein YuzA (DUF378 family)
MLKVQLIRGMMMRMNTADMIAHLLVVIGGINWGLIGFFNYNLVDGIFGAGSMLSRIVYALVGLAALWVFATSNKPKTAA